MDDNNELAALASGVTRGCPADASFAYRMVFEELSVYFTSATARQLLDDCFAAVGTDPSEASEAHMHRVAFDELPKRLEPILRPDQCLDVMSSLSSFLELAEETVVHRSDVMRQAFSDYLESQDIARQTSIHVRPKILPTDESRECGLMGFEMMTLKAG
ncbi:MAG: hypothetical protein AAF550_04955 [Myxococcota bacterium]